MFKVEKVLEATYEPLVQLDVTVTFDKGTDNVGEVVAVSSTKRIQYL